MIKSIFTFILSFFTCLFYAQNEETVMEKLLDSVENYYSFNKEMGFPILDQNKLGTSEEKSLNQIRYYKIKSDIYANVDGYTKDYYDNINQALVLI